MRSIFQHKAATIAVAAGMSCLIAGQTVLADSVRSANRNRSTSYNRTTNVSANRNANVNVNRNANVNVNRSVDVSVHRHTSVHVDVDHHHGGFWAGVGTTMVVGAMVRSIPSTKTVVVVSGT